MERKSRERKNFNAAKTQVAEVRERARQALDRSRNLRQAVHLQRVLRQRSAG